MNDKDILAAFKGPIDKILGLLGSELKQLFYNRLTEYQLEEYKRNSCSKTILHRAEPKALKEFYQPLSIRKDGSGDHKLSTHSAKRLFNKAKYITIIGNAGSGKSTIVKYLFTNCVDEGYKIPIKVELRYLNEFKGNLHEYILNEIFKFQKLGFSNTIIERLLESDNFVFFFDGYDEINSSIKSKTTKDIDTFVTKYPNNRYLITSRPYTNVDLLPLFVNYNVCELSDNDIAAFVKKQIPAEENALAEKIIKAINKKENHSYRSFLSNPLLLSMFILTFQSYSDIPQKRSEFYDQVFDTLFSLHDSMSKLAYVREKLSALPKDQFEEVLRLFSFISFFEEKFLFSPNYLAEKFDVIKSKKKNLEFDNDNFIADLQVAIGILNKEGLDYTFPHRSLQEYFAASYIEKLSVENKKTIYAKLKDDITKNYLSLLTRDHFFYLLLEMDYGYLYKFLIIPLVEDLYNAVNKTSLDDRTAYISYGKILILFAILLKHNKQLKSIFDNIISKNKGYTFLSSKLDDVKTDRIEIVPPDLLSGYNRNVKNFKKSGNIIVNILTKTIEEHEKSDEDIINLI